MWRNLPVSKVNSDKNPASDKNTAPPLKYEKTRTRKLTPKWQVGRPWLQNDKKGMTCGWCTEHRKALEMQNVLALSKFIDGYTSLLFMGGGAGSNFFLFFMEETGRVKTDLGEWPSRPDGECSKILVSNPAKAQLVVKKNIYI